ncbi:Circadian locomoter output cycles protein kaput [Amphibalanus amphitrite]|uniref:Circadian locomoter output cycles protein kaput n=1 Tax=Amphibalanus amphitrite TaxID=1232801 RepID=A0A6A4W394_AMPAM|nr:Circadian locomoter output cycles protein kaput [Amphibalanus amphitrite]
MSCSDADDRDETKRQSRNTNEKKRRDQFNVLVNELSRLVGGASRKMDKSAVLRATIGFLRAHNETSARSRDDDTREEWKPSFLTSDEFTQLMLEGLDAFILAFNRLGKILYVSENVASLLSLLPEDVLFQSLYELMPAEQSAALYDLLSRGDAPAQDGGQRGRFSVMLHLRRGGSTGAAPQYELVQLAGHVHPTAAGAAGSGGDHAGAVYIGICRLRTCQLVRELVLTPSDNGRREFSSRHSLEWKFLFLDHRASHLIGYSAMEVLGTSVYDYYHGDDLHGVADCHEQLMRVGQGTSCFYRFLTKGQKWLWLQTKYYITYHQWNSKPEFIVCTHSAVSLAEVRAQQPRPRCATPQPAPAPQLLTDADPLWSPAPRYSMVELASLAPPRSGALLLTAPPSAPVSSPAPLSRVLLSSPGAPAGGGVPPSSEMLFELPLPPASGADRPTLMFR